LPLVIENFRQVGLPQVGDRIVVGDDGMITEGTLETAQIVDCGGSYLSPGWCDAHVHVWYGGTDFSVRPSEVGRAAGVTSMLDTGSAGEASFHGFREYVIEPAEETIKVLLNIGSIGLVACNRVPELIDWRFIDEERAIATVEANRDLMRGIKVRASGVIVGSWGITPAKIAKRVAEICDLPLMVHIGEPPPLLDEIFDILTPGDIVTHCYNGKKAGSIRDTEALFERAKELADAGVLMDVGHGAASFDFEVARASIAEGLKPFSISTDVHEHNINGSVVDMATTMSKLLAVGLSFEEAVEASTNQPRSLLGLKTPGVPGSRADFTIFDLCETEIEVRDSKGAALRIGEVFEPRQTVLGCDVQDARRRLT